MAEQAHKTQPQQKPVQSGLGSKDATEHKGANQVEIKPKPEAVFSSDGERAIIYTETIRAEASFIGGKKSVMTLKQSREISVILEPEMQ